MRHKTPECDLISEQGCVFKVLNAFGVSTPRLVSEALTLVLCQGQVSLLSWKAEGVRPVVEGLLSLQFSFPPCD